MTRRPPQTASFPHHRIDLDFDQHLRPDEATEFNHARGWRTILVGEQIEEFAGNRKLKQEATGIEIIGDDRMDEQLASQ
jgi:hypothetical protein